MNRPYMLSLVALGLFATPVAAQDNADEETPTAETLSTGDFADKLRDPQVQATVTATAAILGEVLLDMPVGPLVQALDEASGRIAEETGAEAPERSEIAPDATLREVIGPDGDRLSTQLAENLPKAMEAGADMTEAMAKMAPVLKDMAKKLRDALPKELPTAKRD